MVGVDLDKVVGATPSVPRCVPAEQIDDQDPGPGGAPPPGPGTSSDGRPSPGTASESRPDRLARVLAALSEGMDVAEPEDAGIPEAEECGVDAVRARLALMGLSFPRRDGPERAPKRGDRQWRSRRRQP